MSHVIDVRALARDHAARLRELTGGDMRADAILAAAHRDTGVACIPVLAGDSLLDGGDAVYDPEPRLIWYNQEVEPELAFMYQAHEYAHLWLGHAGRSHCDNADLDPDVPDEPLRLGVHRVEGYGPKERRERDANLFARELLLPSDVLRRWFVEERLDAIEIAKRVHVPLGVVHHQLAYAVLVGDLPRIEPPHQTDDGVESESGAGTKGASLVASLDASQREAACIPQGPVLVEAGPGTGKTRTLVARVAHLLENGADPRSILALTFSNKAAEEMRERVAGIAPDVAHLIWMGTFHAFGLELLRKYGTHLGLPTDPPVLDSVDAIFLLERDLATLALDHYQYLPEPTRYLKDILGAISRAKDELATPEDYERAALEMSAAARGDNELLAAEKAREVARVYRAYEAALAERGAVDFGDLIARSVALLSDSTLEVGATVRETYRHVLVDEYQDMNRASAIMLRALAGHGAGLWVVGDGRQSVYRFRGAAPANMARFTEDFPGGRVVRLSTNYRSQRPIVDVVSRFAADMPSLPGVTFTPWVANRPQTTGSVQLEIATTGAAEGRGIASEVQRHRDRGVQFREQAVLCRSHTNLARIGAHLEGAGIPVLYLGDLFERGEVRDLLALLSLGCHGDGQALLRVARFPEYAIPLADVRTILRVAREMDLWFPAALAKLAALSPDELPISGSGRTGFARLVKDIDELCYGTQAWTMLSRYLLERSEYARRLATDVSTVGRQRRLAIFQFLQFVYAQRRARGVTPGAQRSGKKEDPKRTFLRYVRRLAMLGEDAQLRQVPDWATTIDAVRLMTVHGSKGLEFPVVYVPNLGAGIFPANVRWNPCPVPQMLLGAERDAKGEHDREEECLFFVAISRAQDALCLSRALTYAKNGSRKNPSIFLSRLEQVLPTSGSPTPTWATDGDDPTEEMPFDVAQPEMFSVRALDTYLKCPRKFLYQEAFALRSTREDFGYLDLHRCVQRLQRWLAEEAGRGVVVDRATAAERFAVEWHETGLLDHPYESLYRGVAEALFATALDDAMRRRGRVTVSRPEWTLPLSNGTVSVVPDQVDLTDEQGNPAVVVRRVKTGRPTKSESDKDLYALLQEAAVREHGSVARVEISYLATGETEPVELTKKKIKSRIEKYDEAMAAISRGEFPSKPDDYECPRCAHYFVCPAAQELAS